MDNIYYIHKDTGTKFAHKELQNVLKEGYGKSGVRIPYNN